MKKILLLLACVAVLMQCSRKTNEHSAKAALADLKVYPGLKVSLFASEPMLSNPTNLAVDARGRVWVCEAYNYRIQLNPKNPVRKEGDRIMILEDTDGDGQADKSTVFYQGTDVNAALGICILGNKVIVSCSPNILVFTDEDGDDRPDKKEVLFQGIRGTQDDHGAHAFSFGPDGRLYFNLGNAGRVLLDAKGDTVIDVNGNKVFNNGKPFRDGMVLRCNTDGSEVEVLAHNFRNPYEVTIDPYGTLWQSDNDDDGNRGVRINYVMQYGNYGYKDELTGASWGARRTNIEKEIPFRHWHLNDPGVVPNMLQTGSGSPAGISVYEGTLLPEVFRGQLIHAEPGHNVVRAYPIENDGAGYKATVVNILEGQKDQWFRPVDVAFGPDGSLFVADWYDPGVGGHQAGDVELGRIYRVAPESSYRVDQVEVTKAEDALKALLNPNGAARYLGWESLAKQGQGAEAVLAAAWKGTNPRQRAQVLWLLARLPNGDSYLTQALEDSDPNIIITGIRIAQWLKKDMIPVVAKLTHHTSLQVKREAALALRGNHNQRAPELWANLALQHDGKDRWYLEALGIGSFGNEDAFFNAWKKKVGKGWNTPAGRHIVWRIRSGGALPLLAEIIKTAGPDEMLRYYRAFDYQKGPVKQAVLSSLVTQTNGEKVLYALKHMDGANVALSPAVRKALNNALDKYKGRIEFVELAFRFRVENKVNDLMTLCLSFPDSITGIESMKALLEWNKVDVIDSVLARHQKDEVQALIKSMWPHMNGKRALAVMESIVMDSTQQIDNRRLALRTFGGPWNAEDRLLELASQHKIPDDLQVAAAGVFQTAWRSNMREEGAKYLKLPGSREGYSLPSISVLVDKKGKAENGKAVFANTCSNCHQINHEGVNFGPNLSEIGSKLSKEALFTSILYPDQGISFGYEGYKFKMDDGSEAFGMITSETEDKVEIRYMTTQQTLDRRKIQSRVKQETSLMPANLQALMTEQELLDLVAYLGSLKKAN